MTDLSEEDTVNGIILTVIAFSRKVKMKIRTQVLFDMKNKRRHDGLILNNFVYLQRAFMSLQNNNVRE